MNLPNHKQDLLDLQAEIAAKLKALEVPPVLNFTENTITNWNCHKSIPVLDPHIDIYEVSYTVPAAPERWQNWVSASVMPSWSLNSWANVVRIQFRIVKREEKKSIPVEFTTYVPGVTQFRTGVRYLIITDGAPFVVNDGGDIKFPQTITFYRTLGFA